MRKKTFNRQTLAFFFAKIDFIKIRSSHRRCYIKKDVPKNFAKFIGKHLCRTLIFKKVASLGPVTVLKGDSNQVFLCEFCKFFKSTCFIEQVQATTSEFSWNSEVFWNISFLKIWWYFSAYFFRNIFGSLLPVMLINSWYYKKI